jgi:hypothetical protein
MEEEEKLRQFAKIILQELGYKPRCTRKYISQNQAINLLKPVKIGLRRLDTYIEKGIVRIAEEEQENMKRNSTKRLYREDIYKLLNR